MSTAHHFRVKKPQEPMNKAVSDVNAGDLLSTLGVYDK